MGRSLRKFGVEIECMVPASMQAVSDAINAAGVQCYVAGYTHQVVSKWKIVTDGSLVAVSRTINGMRVTCTPMEIVSPVLSGEEGAEQVRKVGAVLRQLGAVVNQNCGLHVHIDARDLGVPGVKKVMKMFAKYEAQFDALLPDSRRHNIYCRSNLATWGGSLEAAFARIDAATTIDGLRSAQNLQRYHKLNLESLPRYGSIEFRMHSGTTDAEKILAWAGMLTGFVDRAHATRRVEKDGAGKMENLLRFADAKSRRFYRNRAKQFANGTASGEND